MRQGRSCHYEEMQFSNCLFKVFSTHTLRLDGKDIASHNIPDISKWYLCMASDDKLTPWLKSLYFGIISHLLTYNLKAAV